MLIMNQYQRNLFTLKEGVHYLNCAYKAPLLKSAEAAAIKDLIKQRNPVDLKPVDYFEEANTVRSLFAELVNCESTEVAIIPSTSYGFSSVLNNIVPKNGQHAITIESEFPSDYFSIQRWCKSHDAELKVIGPKSKKGAKGKLWNKAILDEITEQTAVVILSSIHWMSGMKFDLKEIGLKCKTVGAQFIVDGTQSVGALPMDIKEYHIDALVCATYKWLFGPYSVALAYIGPNFNEGIPLEESWMNRTNAQNFSELTDYDMQYKPNAGRYNVGQQSNLVLMPMLIEGLKQILDWRVEEIQNYAGHLTQPLKKYLEQFDLIQEDEEYTCNHLFSLSLPQEVNKENFMDNIKKENIILSVRGDALRISVNVFNTEEDIQKLIEAIESSRR